MRQRGFQFEDVEDEGERETSKTREVVLHTKEKKKNRMLAASAPELESSLADPVLKEIVTSAARNIISAAR